MMFTPTSAGRRVELCSRRVASLAAQQGHAAAGHDALFDGRLGRVHCVLDPRLLLLHLGLGRCADLDDRHAADELREPLLQLLAIVVRGGLVDLRADLLDPTLDGRVPLPSPSTMVVLSLSMVTFLALPRSSMPDVLELQPEVLGDRLAAGERPRCPRASPCGGHPKPGALTAAPCRVPRSLLTTSVASASPFDVLGHDEQRAIQSRDLFKQRKQVLHRTDLLLVDQDDRILEHDFHPLGVGHEIR